MLELPAAAKQAAVRMRWSQTHNAGRNQSDWAIDNLFIGGHEINPAELRDDFSSEQHEMWIETDNARNAAFCADRCASRDVNSEPFATLLSAMTREHHGIRALGRHFITTPTW